VKEGGEGPGHGSRCADDVVGVMTESWPCGPCAGRREYDRGEESGPVGESWCGHECGPGGEEVSALGGEAGSCPSRDPPSRLIWSRQISTVRIWSRSDAAQDSR
jgi:hypothetical protein